MVETAMDQVYFTDLPLARWLTQNFRHIESDGIHFDPSSAGKSLPAWIHSCRIHPQHVDQRRYRPRPVASIGVVPRPAPDRSVQHLTRKDFEVMYTTTTTTPGGRA